MPVSTNINPPPALHGKVGIIGQPIYVLAETLRIMANDLRLARSYFLQGHFTCAASMAHCVSFYFPVLEKVGVGHAA
jgi:hypothetical protein